MRTVYTICGQHLEDSIVAVCTSLKEVKRVLDHCLGKGAPAYSRLVREFKDRKEYHNVGHWYGDIDVEVYDVTYTEINHIIGAYENED